MTKNAETLMRHLAAENAHDLEGTLATLHPDCVFTDHATGQRWIGREGAAAHYRQHWASFDVTVERIDGQVGFWRDDDIYVAQAVWRGTHNGEFLGLGATGHLFEHPFTVFVRFHEGLMLTEEFFYDISSLIEKLGGQGIAALSTLPYRAVAS